MERRAILSNHETSPVPLACDIMRTYFVAIAPDSTLYDAMSEIVRSGFGMLAVVDPNGWLLGILTRSDLLLARDHLHLVESHMRPSWLAADVSAGAPELANHMIETGLRTIPVLDNGRVVGVVTFRGVLRALST